MTSQYCTIYLVRHGETQWNIDKKIQGQTDIDLTKNGEEQAHKRRGDLKDIHFSHVYSSDLIRARRTAEILNLERKLALTTTKLLRERDFGAYEGKHQDAAQELWSLLYKYNEHPHMKESGVETGEQLVGRALTFLREISVAHPGENILVVSHGGILRTILLHLGYVTQEQMRSGAVQNLAYIRLECDGVDFFVKGTSGIIITSESK